MNIEAFKQDVADALDSGRRTGAGNTGGQPVYPIMTLYTAKCRENAKNASYPYISPIRSAQDLAEAVKYDHMACRMKNGYREKGSFLDCSCIMVDIDNSHSEEPYDWVTEKDIAEAFPFSYFLVRSRNYMREKRKVNRKTGAETVYAPREKWHVYIPLKTEIRDAEEFEQLMLSIMALFPWIDPGAMDSARFFFGVLNPHITYEDNGQTVDEYLYNADNADEIREAQREAVERFLRGMENGYTISKENNTTVQRICGVVGIPVPASLASAPAAQPAAPSMGSPYMAPAADGQAPEGFEWITDTELAQQQAKSIEWLERWAARFDVTLGSRYALGMTHATHPGAVCICVDCPWESEHTEYTGEKETVIIIDRGGKINFLCRHGHCAGRSWSDFRAYYEAKGPVNPAPESDRIEAGWNAHKEARTYAEAAAYLQARAQAPASEKEKEITSENSTETGAGNMDGTAIDSADTATQAADTAGTEAGPVKPDSVSNYIDNVMGDEMAAFGEAIPTGFANLDREAEGLYPGIYVLGAISSLGKTTFCLQLADQVAAAGHDVLFFTMEQSRLEIVSKSLARYTVKAGDSMRDYATSLEIRKGRGGALAWQAAKLYKKDVADRMNVIPGGFGGDGAAPIETAADIVAYIDSYMRANHTKPVVFIDYLQILRATDPFDRGQYTTKGIVDTAITTFKRFSAKRGIAIVVVSSLNRTNYLVPIDYESFKESGGIEYTSDVVWGLQLSCINNPIFNDQNKGLKEKREMINQAKSETPRRVELVCLKNRNGKATYSCGFDYFPAFDTFVPSASDMTAAADISNSYTRRRRRF